MFGPSFRNCDSWKQNLHIANPSNSFLLRNMRSFDRSSHLLFHIRFVVSHTSQSTWATEFWSMCIVTVNTLQFELRLFTWTALRFSRIRTFFFHFLAFRVGTTNSFKFVLLWYFSSSTFFSLQPTLNIWRGFIEKVNTQLFLSIVCHHLFAWLSSDFSDLSSPLFSIVSARLWLTLAHFTKLSPLWQSCSAFFVDAHSHLQRRGRVESLHSFSLSLNCF